MHLFIDEMQTIPGVNYLGMLSEIAKFGGNMVLATQSLATLNTLTPGMGDALMTNLGCLAVFQCNANEARQIAMELGTDEVTSDDVAALPAYNAYMRFMTNGHRCPTFSFRLKEPTVDTHEIVDLIRRNSRAYTRPTDEVERHLFNRHSPEVKAILQGRSSGNRLTIDQDATKASVQAIKERELNEKGNLAQTVRDKTWEGAKQHQAKQLQMMVDGIAHNVPDSFPLKDEQPNKRELPAGGEKKGRHRNR